MCKSSIAAMENDTAAISVFLSLHCAKLTWREARPSFELLAEMNRVTVAEHGSYSFNAQFGLHKQCFGFPNNEVG